MKIKKIILSRDGCHGVAMRCHSNKNRFLHYYFGKSYN